MRGVHRGVVLLSLLSLLLLLFANKCVPARADSENPLDLRARDDGGGDVEHQQTVITHEEEDGHGPVDQKKEAQPVGKSNDTDTVGNETLQSTAPAVKPTTPAPPTAKPILPVQTGVKAQEEEQSSGLTIFFSLLVIAGSDSLPSSNTSWVSRVQQYVLGLQGPAIRPGSPGSSNMSWVSKVQQYVLGLQGPAIRPGSPRSSNTF
ncbi:sodium/hydrogen exchanger 8 [Cyclopterus lumpus]|uniref:sodium/hydrogen exchanger 8 n=1 Tax=Cyclopterus lumpus TaxID=8103 RepID=UPI0014863F7B|nr:sodium/hydrogen exchanger 8 [Cyclopterus lumpus]